MAYNKQNWVDLPNTSTPISAERLNYMEQGIYDASLSGGSGVYVGETEPTEENINAWINPKDNTLKYKNNGEWIGTLPSGDSMPIGTILPFASMSIPENYLLCDGSEISRTTYEDLFTKIGTSFGEGNGTDTFNLPDLRGRIPIGAGSSDNNTHNFALGSTGGEYEHTLTVAEMPSHKHNLTWYDAGSGGGAKLPYGLSSTKKTGGDSSIMDSAGGSSSHNNMQPYSTVNYIIKYSNSIGLVGNVVNEKSNSTKDSYCCDYMNNLVDYSTNETRVGTWINGKPIYRKVVYDTTPRSVGNYDISHGIQNYDEIVSYKTLCYQSSSVIHDGSSTSSLSGSERVTSYFNNSNISIKTSWTIVKTIIIIEYTKTTD